MKRSTLFAMFMFFAVMIVLGVISTADARNPMMGMMQDLTPEQQSAVKNIHIEYNKIIPPLQQQLIAKKAELKTLLYSETSINDPKVKSLVKEIRDIKVNLYAAELDMRIKLKEQGIDFPGRHGGLMRGNMMPGDMMRDGMMPEEE